MADLYNIVCITTIADTAEEFVKLYNALLEIDKTRKKTPALSEIVIGELQIPQQKLGLREVMYCETARKELSKCEGRISRSIITPYPPGIPLVCPGEVITADIIEYIKCIIDAGGDVNGILQNNEIEVVL